VIPESYAAQKKKLYETVIEQVDKLLSSGRYKLGDKLPSIDELSQMFKASKPTLREAFSVLASTGVLEISHGRGIFIKSLTVRTKRPVVADFADVTGSSLLHWLEFRRTVEVEAAALAAKRRTDAEVAHLERLIGAIEAKLNAGEIAEDLDYEFHVAIAQATHNPIYANALKTNAHALQHHIFEDVRQSLTVPARKLLIMEEHRKILESIRRGNAAQARRAMETHLLNAERKLRLLNDESTPTTR
jgi:GntR family transcriptional repressor for pyruvate dehydrogenase complex